jgi:hypothetical protein
MLLSYHQNGDQNRDVKRANRSVENVAQSNVYILVKDSDRSEEN